MRPDGRVSWSRSQTQASVLVMSSIPGRLDDAGEDEDRCAAGMKFDIASPGDGVLVTAPCRLHQAALTLRSDHRAVAACRKVSLAIPRRGHFVPPFRFQRSVSPPLDVQTASRCLGSGNAYGPGVPHVSRVIVLIGATLAALGSAFHERRFELGLRFPMREPHADNCSLLVFATLPGRKYDELGIFDVPVQHIELAGHEGPRSAAELLWVIQAEACRIGADAMVAEPDERGFYVRAVAIAWMSQH